MPTRPPRPIAFRCEWCSQEVTELHPPGPLPRYCAEHKAEAQRALNAGRVRRHRERQAEQQPMLKRPRGRPRTR